MTPRGAVGDHRRGRRVHRVGAPAAADGPPMPGIEIDGDTNSCTAGFAAQGPDGFYLMTSGHCDRDAGAQWTYGDDEPLGYMAASENDDSQGTRRGDHSP